jgi:hypothetical protein
MGCTEIAKTLNSEGYTTPLGNKWSGSNVRKYMERYPDWSNRKPDEPEPTPPDEAMPLPAAAEITKLEYPFIRHILDSRELTDTKKVAMLRILI